jgi:hypothetical protein
LAYVTDTLAEAEKLHVVPIDSPLAAAIQPFARPIERLQVPGAAVAGTIGGREAFISAGFRWRLGSGVRYERHTGEAAFQESVEAGRPESK